MENQYEESISNKESINHVLDLTFPNQKDSLRFIIGLAVGFVAVGWIFYNLVSSILGIILVLIALWLLYQAIEQYFQPSEYKFTFDKQNNVIIKDKKRFLGEVDKIILKKDNPIITLIAVLDGRERELFTFVYATQKEIAL
ncbi:MAG: hypothetical protein ACRCXZ_01535, partial [Patescibacteria group bacterium]